MKRLIAALLLMPALAFGQTVSKPLTITWSLPTISKDGLPLTGQYAITSVQLFLSTSPIPDTAATPTITLTSAAISAVHTMSVANGQRVYVRMKACNAKCGDLTPDASVPVTLDTTPGVATNVTIKLEIGSP
jgi:hypothetical protein